MSQWADWLVGLTFIVSFTVGVGVGIVLAIGVSALRSRKRKPVI